MGMEYFSNQIKSDNDENIEKREIFFTNISREKLGTNKKRSISKDKINIESYDEDIIFEKNISKYCRKKTFSNISSFLMPNDNDNIFSSSFNSSTISVKDGQKRNNNNRLINDNDEYLRKIYYQKLVCQNIININKEELKNNTLFIFDWDDTLFSTSHFNFKSNNLFFFDNENEKKMINTIEYYIIEILNKALDKGTVLIITNSADGWVEACTKFYYPNLISMLNRIYIISSRELYQKEYPGNPLTWKIKTFNDLKNIFNFEKPFIINIVCIGDDNNEIIAAKNLAETTNKCIVKTIKFREGPDIKELIKQLILINEQLLKVYRYPKSLTIQVEKTKKRN